MNREATTLFGTADATIWSLNTATGQFRTLFVFDRDTDGDVPEGGLVLSGNVLYGTNVIGGAYGDGTLWPFLIPRAVHRSDLTRRPLLPARAPAIIRVRLTVVKH